MKVVMISTDRKIFEEGSEVRGRMLEYGSLVDELHIIVFSKRTSGFIKQQISNNVWIYPTDSRSRWLYVFDAVRIGRSIIGNWKSKIENARGKFLITSQDPFETGLAGLLVARHKNIPLQVQVHTDFLSPYFRGILNTLRLLIASFVLPRASCIRVVSERIKESIQNRYTLTCTPTVLPVFVDVAALRDVPITTDVHKKYPQFDFIILIASRLEPEKDIEHAFTVMKKVLSQHSQAGLVVVGDGSECQRLKQMVHTLGLENNVVFEGWQHAVGSYYKTADLLLVTSQFEGYGRNIVEALAVGCPVLAVDVGIAREVGARVVEKELVAEELMRLIKTPQRGMLNNIHYADKDRYLEGIKRSFEQCLAT